MMQFLNLFGVFGYFILLMLIGFVFGRLAEKRHYKSIRKREDEYRDLLVIPSRRLPIEFKNHESQLVQGNVVVAVDYFKMVVAGLRNLVGGRVSVFESLLDRARREAILRMQAEARKSGADAVFNFKFETIRLSGGRQRGIMAVEVLAYGTALSKADPDIA